MPSPSSRWLRIIPVVSLSLLFLPAASFGAPQTFSVTNTGDSGPGSLRQAISDAEVNPGPDLINFASGLDGMDLTLTSGELLITDTGGAVTIDASLLPGGFVIDGNANGRVLHIPNADSVVNLKGLTLRNGQTTDGGGGILSFGKLTVEGCTVSANLGRNGGGLSILNSELTVIDSFISNNLTQPAQPGSSSAEAGSGAGIYAYQSFVTVSGSEISGNRTGDGAQGDAGTGSPNGKFGRPGGSGGGIYSFDGDLEISGSTISGNSTGDGGPGGVKGTSADGGPGGLGGLGGGLYSLGRAVLRNCRVSMNFTGNGGQGTEGGSGGLGGRGGGIYTSGGTQISGEPERIQGNLILIDSTVSENHSGDGGTGSEPEGGNGGQGGRGGGVYAALSYGAYLGLSTVSIKRSSITGNRTGAGNAPSSGGGSSGIGGPGGGIYNSGADLTISNTSITENVTGPGFNTGHGGDGAGIFFDLSGTNRLTNVTIAGNTTSPRGDGAGIHSNSYYRTIDLRHVTVTGNIAGAGGRYGGFFASGIIRVTNSIIAGNTADTYPDLRGTIDEPFGVNFIGGDPDLAPLTMNGGTTETALPNAGSPVIDAADDLVIPPDVNDLDGDGDTVELLPFDQRGGGFPRISGAGPDIGAIERIEANSVTPRVFTVTNTNDGGGGSLRQAIAQAANNPGRDLIAFSPNLNGEKLDLTSGELSVIETAGEVEIDASALPDGFTIDAGQNSRLLSIPHSQSIVTLRNLILKNGQSTPGEDGGGIWNAGDLALIDATISGNSTSDGSGDRAGNGGGIFNTGTLSVWNSSISDNTTGNGGGPGPGGAGFPGGSGGGIFSDGGALAITNTSLNGNRTGNGYDGGGACGGSGGGLGISGDADVTLTNVTIAGNATGSGFFGGPGGGIETGTGNPTVRLIHTTVTNNTAAPAAGGGGVQAVKGDLIVTNSIIGGNTADSDPDLSGMIDTETGVNFVGGDPMLAPVGTYGSDSEIAPPVFGSPALDAAAAGVLPQDTDDLDGDSDTTEPLPVDQRGLGFPRFVGAAPDIGAVEGFGASSYQADARIGTRSTASTHRGNDLYNLTGAGQSIRIALKGKRKAKHYLTLENDSPILDSLRARMNRPGRTTAVSIFQLTGGRTNITGALIAGTHLLPDLEPGETVLIQVDAKARSKRKKALQTLRFGTNSETVPGQTDTAKSKWKSRK